MISSDPRRSPQEPTAGAPARLTLLRHRPGWGQHRTHDHDGENGHRECDDPGGPALHDARRYSSAELGGAILTQGYRAVAGLCSVRGPCYREQRSAIVNPLPPHAGVHPRVARELNVRAPPSGPWLGDSLESCWCRKGMLMRGAWPLSAPDTALPD